MDGRTDTASYRDAYDASKKSVLYDSRPMALTVSDYSKEYADFVVIERSSNGSQLEFREVNDLGS